MSKNKLFDKYNLCSYILSTGIVSSNKFAMGMPIGRGALMCRAAVYYTALDLQFYVKSSLVFSTPPTGG